mgnify:CR=1 FL=1
MPDRKDDLRVIEGEVTETKSSDAYIERTVATLVSEIEATTGTVVDILGADIHKPKLVAQKTTLLPEVENPQKNIPVDPLSRFVVGTFKDRQEKKVA